MHRGGHRVVSVTALSIVLAGCGPDQAAGQRPAPSTSTAPLGSSSISSTSLNSTAPVSPTSASSRPADLQLDFDDVASPGGFVAKVRNVGSADLIVDVVTAVGGGLRAVSSHRSAKDAVSTPEFTTDGPRAVLGVSGAPRSGGPDPLAPGNRKLTIAADVRLDDGRTSSKGAGSSDNGDNVVQRGLFGGRGQYKLQVDGRQASCRVRGDAGEVLVTVERRLKPREWYRLTCTRSGNQVTLRVARYDPGGLIGGQWTERESAPIGSVEFDPAVPLSVGGKLTDSGRLADQVDQFNGRIDAVSVDVG
ncbi:MAG: hypothetical protein ACRC35_12125 [Angustibacter sp.]